MEKYKIAEINDIVARWLLNTDPEQNSIESHIFDEIFRQDDVCLLSSECFWI